MFAASICTVGDLVSQASPGSCRSRGVPLCRGDAATGLRSAGGADSSASASGPPASWASPSRRRADHLHVVLPHGPLFSLCCRCSGGGDGEEAWCGRRRRVVRRGSRGASPREGAGGRAEPIRSPPARPAPVPSGSARSRRRGGRRAADGDGGRECRAAGGDAGVRPTEGT